MLADDLTTFIAKTAFLGGADIRPQQLQGIRSLWYPSRDRFVETNNAGRKFAIRHQRGHKAKFFGRTDAACFADVQQRGVTKPEIASVICPVGAPDWKYVMARSAAVSQANRWRRPICTGAFKSAASTHAPSHRTSVGQARAQLPPKIFASRIVLAAPPW